MRVAAGQTSTSAHTSGFFPIVGYFRETNAEGQRIRGRLGDALQLADTESRQADALTAITDVWRVIRKEIEEAAIRAEAIENLRTSDPETHAWYARELIEINNSWDDLSQLWPSMTADEPLAKLVARAKQSVKALDALIFLCACQTIPNELDNYLGNYRPGKCLDFVATFKDQLPDETMTRAVLAWLAPQSGIVSGLIDLESAKVIKADQRLGRQLASVGGVTAVAGLGFGLIAIAVASWSLTPAFQSRLNLAYVLVLLGVLGHWVLDRVKQSRSGSDITPFAEWLMWIHINEVPITTRIATVWIVVALAIGFKTIDLTTSAQPLACFTAGYFLDSTFDALIGRLNTFMSANDPSKKSKAAN